MRITVGRKMILATINVSTGFKPNVNNSVWAENASRSLTGLGMNPFSPPRHPTFSSSQAWFVEITNALRHRFENDLTMFVDVTEECDSLDVCRRIMYAWKQAIGTAGQSLDSNIMAYDMDMNQDYSGTDLFSFFTDIDPDVTSLGFHVQDYDRVLSESPVTSTGITATFTTSATQGSSNPALNNTRIGPTVAQAVRRGVENTIGPDATNTAANLAHNVANAGRNVLGDINDAMRTIAGSNQLIQFAVYGLVIFAVVSASTKLINTVKN